MSSLGDIVIGLKMDAAPFAAGAQSARGSLRSIASTALSAASQLASLVGISAGLGAIGFGVKLAADAEQAQIAFEVMLGSAGAAKKMLGDLKAFSDKSPFDTIVPRHVAQTLINFGLAGESIMPTIRMLGDVAAGDADKLQRLGLVYGQMSAAGRLMGQDLLQFINAGFNPLQQIAARTGESMLQLKARMEAGGISAQEVAQAFKDATSAGGRFYGMTARQAETLGGLWSTTKDTILSTLTVMGAQIVEKLDLKAVLRSSNEWLGLASEIMKTYGGDIMNVVKVLAAMAIAVGIVRTAMLAYSVVQSLVIAKEIVLKALSGPAGWAMIAAAVVGAGIAIKSLGNEFDAVARKARNAAGEIAKAAEAGNAPKKAADPAHQLKALQDRLRELQSQAKFAPQATAILAQREVGAVDIPGLLGIKQIGKAAEEASPRLRLLKDALAFVQNELSKSLPADQITALSGQIQAALIREKDAQSGVTEAIAKQREELEKLKAEADPNYETNKLKEKGASTESLAMLDGLKAETDQLREQKKLAEEFASMRKQEGDELQRRAEQLKNSTMTEAEKLEKEVAEIKELFAQGLIDEETYNRGLDQAGGKKTEKDRKNPTALRGSSEAAEIMLRGTGNQEKKMESLTATLVDLSSQNLAAVQANGRDAGFQVEEIVG